MSRNRGENPLDSKEKIDISILCNIGNLSITPTVAFPFTCTATITGAATITATITVTATITLCRF